MLNLIHILLCRLIYK